MSEKKELTAAQKKSSDAKIKAAQAGKEGSEYLPKESERHLYHVELDAFQWDRGDKTSKPFVQMYTEKEFTQLMDNVIGMGFKSDKHEPIILWNPEAYKK